MTEIEIGQKCDIGKCYITQLHNFLTYIIAATLTRRVKVVLYHIINLINNLKLVLLKCC